MCWIVIYAMFVFFSSNWVLDSAESAKPKTQISPRDVSFSTFPSKRLAQANPLFFLNTPSSPPVLPSCSPTLASASNSP